jgi:beta-phosphoglucomutase-like phosphatase (HAD superfamily)
MAPVIEAVIFDLDGVLLDSEELWDRARRDLVEQGGGRWQPGATEAMQGMSSAEWSAYVRDELGVPLSAGQINDEVVARLLGYYQDDLPLIAGAPEAVRRMAGRWPLGLASSSNRSVIDTVLERAGLASLFQVTVSSEEVDRGKPAPDVYLAVAERLHVPPPACAAVEDSANGIRSGVNAGMSVVAIPDHRYPPPAEVLALARCVLPALSELTPAVLS